MVVAQREILPAEISYAEYVAEGRIEGRYDIIEGIRVFTKDNEMPGAEWRHQRIVGNIYFCLRLFEQEKQRGRAVMAPLDVVIRRSPRLQTRQPDVLFVSLERLAQSENPDNPAPLEIGPELAVEVLSPSETPRTLQNNINDFVLVGVRECWIVSPEAETVQVLRLSEEGGGATAVYAYGQTLTSLAFPELTLSVADIFAD